MTFTRVSIKWPSKHNDIIIKILGVFKLDWLGCEQELVDAMIGTEINFMTLQLFGVVDYAPLHLKCK